jgi:bifunctional non-homologous end joining protein LigD
MECLVADGRARLISRNGKEWTDRFSDIARAAVAIPVDSAILDGEVVVFDREGGTDFQALQNIKQGLEKGSLSYVVFDIPYCGGYDLTRCPLIERKEFLGRLLGSGDGAALRFSDHIAGEGETVLQNACGLGLEGIISKQADSPYEPKRSRRWLKVKCGKRQEFVIGCCSAITIHEAASSIAARWERALMTACWHLFPGAWSRWRQQNRPLKIRRAATRPGGVAGQGPSW